MPWLDVPKICVPHIAFWFWRNAERRPDRNFVWSFLIRDRGRL
jgi:hypothetical protein